MRLAPRLLIGTAFLLLLPCVVSVLAFGELATAAPLTPTPRLPITPDATTTAARREATAEQLYLGGLAAYQSGDYRSAQEQFQAATALEPDNANWHNSLGLTLAELGQLDTAAAQYEQALALDPGLAEAHYNLGAIYQARGNLQRARDAYWAAIVAQPDFALAYNNLGAVYSDLGRPDEALAAFQEATELDPSLAAAHVNLGAAYAARGDDYLQHAANEFEIAARLEPQSPEIHFNLVVIQSRQGRPDLARISFDRVIDLAPESEWAAEARAQIRQLKP